MKEPPKSAGVHQMEVQTPVQTPVHTPVQTPIQTNHTPVHTSVQIPVQTKVPTLPAVNISATFRTLIPENGAYWNRLLHSSLKRADQGENPLSRVPPWPYCRNTNQELIETNVLDVDSYPLLLRNFLWGMKCRSPPFLMDQPNKCKENGTFLLFAIKSMPAHFERRQVW